MTTAEALERITDVGRFEILATRVLRELHPECKALAHLGVNAAGKTIPNPVDGFSRVTGVPPLYVMAAFTTGGTETLEHKWLFDAAAGVKRKKTRKTTRAVSATDGDLVKAAREAGVIRQDDATARFTVYLCTNRRLDLEIMHSVYAKARGFDIEACFLEQSRLRDFLDSKPEGQWLRQQFLGIEADQISRSLLQNLGHRSLRDYCAEMLLSDIDEIVATSTGDAAYDAIRDRSTSLHLLVGPSGAGKTVIGQDVMRRHLAGGGLALWLPGQVADQSVSLPDALEEVLRSLHPRIGNGEGHRALELATPDEPLLLVVDDINRSRAPSTVLNRITGWCRLSSSAEGDGERPRSSVQVVCPLWDHHWNAVESRLRGANWLRARTVGPLLQSEAVKCLKTSLRECAAGYTEAELTELAEKMNRDAILLGLFGRLFRSNPESNPRILAEDVIGSFVESTVSELSQQTHTSTADYVSVLTSLAREMIRRKSLYPLWADLQEWFGAGKATFDALRHLTAQQHVCRITSGAGVQRFEFRHDRILEYYLSRATVEILQGTDADRELISDPFFIPIVGRSLGRLQPSDALLDWVMERVPVALIYATPFLSTKTGDRVLDRACGWLAQCGTALESIREDALGALVETQSPHVLRITSGAPGCERVWQARFRNGDPVAGARALSLRFFPAVTFPWLESLIGNTKSLHRGQLVTGLKAILTANNLDDQLLRGAFSLSGYIADSDLAPFVKIAWEAATDKTGVLVEALWAALRCADCCPSEVLGAIMPMILETPDDDGSGGMSQRAYLLEELAFACRHGIGEPVLSYLVALGSAQQDYAWVVTILLEKIDHPLAVGYTVRKLAWSKHQAEQSGASYPFAMMWADQWTRRMREEGRPLSVASLDELRSLWATENSPDWLSAFAFSVWVRCHPDPFADRSLLTHASSRDATVWLRATRGDSETVPEVADRLRCTSRWLYVVAGIWCKELESGVDLWLESIGGHELPEKNAWNDLNYGLARLLRDIPRDDSQKLLLKHWSRVRLIPLFIQVALYLGTDETRSLASESLQEIPADEDPFRYIDHFFGFKTQGISERLKLEHLDSLQPYLNRLGASCIEDMAEYCHQHDYWAWALEHLRPECLRRLGVDKTQEGEESLHIVRIKRHWFPSDQDLISELNDFEQMEPRERAGRVWFWLDRLAERRVTAERWLAVLENWLTLSPTKERILVGAAMIRQRGPRTALRILRPYFDKGITSEFDDVLADTEYAVRRHSLD